MEKSIREVSSNIEVTRQQIDKMQQIAKPRKTAAEGMMLHCNFFFFFFSIQPINKIEILEVQLSCKGTFTGHTGAIWALALTHEGFLKQLFFGLSVDFSFGAANLKFKLFHPN